MTIGLLGPSLEVRRLRHHIEASWRIVEMWEPDEVARHAHSCQAIAVAAGEISGQAVIARLPRRVQDIGQGVPLLYVGRPSGSLPTAVRFIRRYGPEVQEALLDLVLAPLFRDWSIQVEGREDLGTGVRTLLAEILRRSPPSFREALGLADAGTPPFPRHVKDAAVLSRRSRSYLFAEAAVAGVSLAEFLKATVALHGLGRWIPGRRPRYRLARRLAFNQGDSLEQAMRRGLGMGLQGAMQLPLTAHAARLLNQCLPPPASM